MEPIKILPKGGHTYVNGLSSRYDSDTFPPEISNLISWE